MGWSHQRGPSRQATHGREGNYSRVKAVRGS